MREMARFCEISPSTVIAIYLLKRPPSIAVSLPHTPPLQGPRNATCQPRLWQPAAVMATESPVRSYRSTRFGRVNGSVSWGAIEIGSALIAFEAIKNRSIALWLVITLTKANIHLSKHPYVCRIIKFNIDAYSFRLYMYVHTIYIVIHI